MSQREGSIFCVWAGGGTRQCWKRRGGLITSTPPPSQTAAVKSFTPTAPVQGGAAKVKRSRGCCQRSDLSDQTSVWTQTSSLSLLQLLEPVIWFRRPRSRATADSSSSGGGGGRRREQRSAANCIYATAPANSAESTFTRAAGSQQTPSDWFQSSWSPARLASLASSQRLPDAAEPTSTS